MSATAHCTFCDLIAGAAEVSVCYEDADALAFMDIQPVNAGHVLVVPREHHESILDVPQELGVHLFRITMRLVAAVQRVSRCDGVNIVVNSGAAAGQDEMHYHVHIIPRQPGDDFDIPLPFGGSQMPDRTVLDMQAARIIAALRDPIGRGNRRGGSDADGRAEAVQGAPADREIRTPIAHRGDVAQPSADSDERPVGVSPNRLRRPSDRVEAPIGYLADIPLDESLPPVRLYEGAHGELISGG
jgi:histidine triad (HIT) family protein